MTVKEILLARL